MEILITGCERSGTKMLSKHLGEKYNIRFNLENKHTIATFKYYQEIVRWVKYKNDNYPLDNVTKFEKHTLNKEINIDFLKWVKQEFPYTKIYYIIRDGRDVVSSIINRIWGNSQTSPNYTIEIEDACYQWNLVVDKTWDWAKFNCEVVRYEDICDVVSTPLNNEQNALATTLLTKNLIKTNYL